MVDLIGHALLALFYAFLFLIGYGLFVLAFVFVVYWIASKLH